ncbi:hypothetical protein BDW75DRAFT_69051 [Aspergillus navahoensis]
MLDSMMILSHVKLGFLFRCSALESAIETGNFIPGRLELDSSVHLPSSLSSDHSCFPPFSIPPSFYFYHRMIALYICLWSMLFLLRPCLS